MKLAGLLITPISMNFAPTFRDGLRHTQEVSKFFLFTQKSKAYVAKRMNCEKPDNIPETLAVRSAILIGSPRKVWYRFKILSSATNAATVRMFETASLAI